jgi:hypothetical protein
MTSYLVLLAHVPLERDSDARRTSIGTTTIPFDLSGIVHKT